MALPEIERHRIDKALFELMVQKSPAFVQDDIQITASTRGNKVTVIEERLLVLDPGVRVEHKVAQLEYTPESKNWSLYCYDRNSKRHPYPNGSNKSLNLLMKQLIEDPTGIFWG